MLDLNVNCETIFFRSIESKDFSILRKWYNKTEDFGFATGNKSLDAMKRLFYSDSIPNFFLAGIYLYENKALIGVLSGELKKEKKGLLWIRFIMIDKAWQRKGFGRQAIRLLLGYMKKKYRISLAVVSVVEANCGAVRFWSSLGFKIKKTLKKDFLNKQENMNILIMQRIL